jgi:hypothetical protein
MNWKGSGRKRLWRNLLHNPGTSPISQTNALPACYLLTQLTFRPWRWRQYVPGCEVVKSDSFADVMANYLHQVSRLSKCGAVPPLPHGSSWRRLNKHRNNFTIYLFIYLFIYSLIHLLIYPFIYLPITSSRTMALGSTQPLTEMSTSNLPGGKGPPAREADNLTAICESIF